ncbi:hypothetical protein NQ317_017934 [Molorchus minor]|uniref:Chitin-binding type-2 domain-containing protein n=1 Tax=Molorchus minor TaxID=1323400 RepID=A0ABQ9JRJ6_9CUCU|nr:hypothetical protein NQ317_017934 [Molorchus minor]
MFRLNTDEPERHSEVEYHHVASTSFEGSHGITSGQRKISRNLSVGSEVKANFDCPEEFGYYPHPTDCTQYYVCVFGGALLESCTGGLMYSHELQTCDWPRNVGCDGTEVSGTPSSSLSSSSSTTSTGRGRERDRERDRDETRTRYSPPPPPPQPAAVVTSRGQPRQLHHTQQEIIKQQEQQQLYADAEETLPPAEEIESDRQQRVYRGQPSTVGQVQRDRDGLRHSNAIPSYTGRGEKIGVISFGTQNQHYSGVTDDDEILTNDLTLKRRRKRQANKSRQREDPNTWQTRRNTNRNTATRVNTSSRVPQSTQNINRNVDFRPSQPQTKSNDDFQPFVPNYQSQKPPARIPLRNNPPSRQVSQNNQQVTSSSFYPDVNSRRPAPTRQINDVPVAYSQKAPRRQPTVASRNGSRFTQAHQLLHLLLAKMRQIQTKSIPRTKKMKIVLRMKLKLTLMLTMKKESIFRRHLNFFNSENRYANIENPFADPNFDFDKFLDRLRGPTTPQPPTPKTTLQTREEERDEEKGEEKEEEKEDEVGEEEGATDINNNNTEAIKPVSSGLPLGEGSAQSSLNPYSKSSPPSTPLQYQYTTLKANLPSGFGITSSNARPVLNQYYEPSSTTKPTLFLTQQSRPILPAYSNHEARPTLTQYYERTEKPTFTNSDKRTTTLVKYNDKILTKPTHILNEKRLTGNRYYEKSTDAPTKLYAKQDAKPTLGEYYQKATTNPGNPENGYKSSTIQSSSFIIHEPRSKYYQTSTSRPISQTYEKRVQNEYVLRSTAKPSPFETIPSVNRNDSSLPASFGSLGSEHYLNKYYQKRHYKTINLFKPELLQHVQAKDSFVTQKQYSYEPEAAPIMHKYSAQIKSNMDNEKPAGDDEYYYDDADYDYLQNSKNKPHSSIGYNYDDTYELGMPSRNKSNAGEVKYSARYLEKPNSQGIKYTSTTPNAPLSKPSSDNVNTQPLHTIYLASTTPSPPQTARPRKGPTSRPTDNTITSTTVKPPRGKLRLTTQRYDVDTKREQSKLFRSEERSVAPAQPSNPTATATARTLYNSTQYNNNYDPYYALYDDDVELYRDVDYSAHNNYNGNTKTQAPTYRGTPAPAVQSTSTREESPKRGNSVYLQNYNPQDIYQSTGADYADDNRYDTQVDDQTSYRQSSRQPSRGDRNELNDVEEAVTKRTTTTRKPTTTTTRTTTTTTTTQRTIPSKKSTPLPSRTPVTANENQTQAQSNNNTKPEDPGQNLEVSLSPPLIRNNPNISGNRLDALQTPSSTYRPKAPITDVDITLHDSNRDALVQTFSPFSLLKQITTVQPAFHYITKAPKSTDTVSSTVKNRYKNSSSDNSNTRSNQHQTTTTRRAKIIVPTTYSPPKFFLKSILPKSAPQTTPVFNFRLVNRTDSRPRSDQNNSERNESHKILKAVRRLINPVAVNHELSTTKGATYESAEIIASDNSGNNKDKPKLEPDQPPSYKPKPIPKPVTATDASFTTPIPTRASRVNSAIKSLIAIGGTRRPNSKCNENQKCNTDAKQRTNSRGRGATHYANTGAQITNNEVTVNTNRGTPAPRSRPTLKPSTSIVSKASEFVDIYKFPPRRPDALYPQPQPDKTAAKCRKDVCLLPDCNCGGKEIPGDLPVEETPQMVLITFDDAVNDLNKQYYIDLFENGRKNPNGCPITATFYVSHEWTDYSQVQNLYADGHEMASHTVSIGDFPVEQVPQIVLLTFDDSVNDLNKGLYMDLFEKGRVNPNGCPIAATFYVSHEWTDYSQVQNLYSDGHEIASHTVSHSFGEQFSQKKWTREVAGQREILSAYGGVHLEDVRGMRAPFLSVGGNKMFKMLYDSNFTYDSSMPIYENKPPSWPYTLDYKLFHDCMIPPCPTRSYPGVWEVPMVMWQDLNGGRCSMGDACSNPPDADGVFKMLTKNFQRHYTTNRAPFGLFYHAAWFTQPHHKEGFINFIDSILQEKDVWLLTNWQAIQWVRDPTPTSRLNSFQPFQCEYSDRPRRCNNPKVCNLWHKSGVRYMRTCQPCPDIYPWTGNTGIRSSRIDNDIED